MQSKSYTVARHGTWTPISTISVLIVFDHEGSEPYRQISAGAITTICLLILIGCRKTEIMMLSWKHVDLDRAEVCIVNGKTGDRTAPLSPSAVKLLTALQRESDNFWIVPIAKPGTYMADIDES